MGIGNEEQEMQMGNKTAPLLIIEKGLSDASVVVLDETPHVLGKTAVGLRDRPSP